LERSNARRVVDAAAGRTREVLRNHGRQLSRARRRGAGSDVGRKTAETDAARAQVNGAAAPVLGSRRVVVVVVRERMSRVPFLQIVHGVLEELTDRRDQSPEQEQGEGCCGETLHG
jgi:hypothetical protein